MKFDFFKEFGKMRTIKRKPGNSFSIKFGGAFSYLHVSENDQITIIHIDELGVTRKWELTPEEIIKILQANRAPKVIL